MPFLTRIKIFLWRPFEINSSDSPEKIEHELSSRIIKEPTFHLLPYYEKLVGNVENGSFKISFTPLSSLFSRGAGKITIRGKIENRGKGSRIYGCLPGPAFPIWLLAFIALGLFLFVLAKSFLQLPGLSHQTIEWVPYSIFELILTLFTVFMFVFDRVSNRDGEGKILALLKEVAG